MAVAVAVAVGGARAAGGIAGGVLASLGWARVDHSWPFASVQVREVCLELQNGAADQASADASDCPSPSDCPLPPPA